MLTVQFGQQMFMKLEMVNLLTFSLCKMEKLEIPNVLFVMNLEQLLFVLLENAIQLFISHVLIEKIKYHF